MYEPTNKQTVSAPQQGQRLQCLEPATNEQFRNELTACLALVAPVGMTEEARRDWLAIAWGTLGHLPADLLSIGCKTARETCDHPSRIVPTILRVTDQSLKWRRDAMRDENPQQRLPRPDYCTPTQAAEILKEYGLK